MTAPARYRGVHGTIPGRLTVLVRLPTDLLVEADRVAESLGKDRSVVLGDLVASELPAALAEAAEELVGGPARQRLAINAQRPGELTPGRASELSLNADCSLPLPPARTPDGSGGTG